MKLKKGIQDIMNNTTVDTSTNWVSIRYLYKKNLPELGEIITVPSRELLPCTTKCPTNPRLHPRWRSTFRNRSTSKITMRSTWQRREKNTSSTLWVSTLWFPTPAPPPRWEWLPTAHAHQIRTQPQRSHSTCPWKRSRPQRHPDALQVPPPLPCLQGLIPQECLCSRRLPLQSPFSKPYLEILPRPCNSLWRQCIQQLCNLCKGRQRPDIHWRCPTFNQLSFKLCWKTPTSMTEELEPTLLKNSLTSSMKSRQFSSREGSVSSLGNVLIPASTWEWLGIVFKVVTS